MNRSTKVFITVLIIVLGILASSTGFFYAKVLKFGQQDKTVSTTSPAESNEESGETSLASENTSTATSAVTEVSSASNRPSTPTDTHKVAAGESMSSIGSEFDLNWITLAEANGLSSDDADKIKVGQVLIIPKNNQISYTVNAAKAQEIQTKVDGGKDAFRLSAADTAKSDAPSAYGLAVTDTFTQKTIDTTAGTATVIGIHNGKNYEIKLTQPATKGEKGIWAIASIKLTS